MLSSAATTSLSFLGMLAVAAVVFLIVVGLIYLAACLIYGDAPSFVKLIGGTVIVVVILAFMAAVMAFVCE